MRKKIIIVAARYGCEINGGEEAHTKMLAERLAEWYDVEILTTCLDNQRTPRKIYDEGTTYEHKICIKRFNTPFFNVEKSHSLEQKAKVARKIRRMIYRFRLSSFFFGLFPVWHFREKQELNYFKTSPYYSNVLVTYLNENAQHCKAVILFSCYNVLAYFVSAEVYKKSILIPTAHYDRGLFFSITSQLFHRVAYIGFNTFSEQKMCARVFQKGMAKNGIISTGVNIAKPIAKAKIIGKYQLPENYLLYFGRINKSKLGNIIPYFLAYKNKYNDDLYLVLTGNLYTEKVEHPYIIYTGFVTDEEKITLIEQSRFVVNPSKKESLSLLLLEAMYLGKTVLVNGHAEVLNEHCIKSGFAVDYYMNKKSFIQKLHHLYTNPQLVKENELKAKKYVAENYDWNIIMQRLTRAIENI